MVRSFEIIREEAMFYVFNVVDFIKKSCSKFAIFYGIIKWDITLRETQKLKRRERVKLQLFEF